MNLGRILLKQGKWREALREFEAAVRVAPSDAGAAKALLDRALRLFQQGYEHQMSGELDEAAALYQASIGLFPTAEAHTFLAWHPQQSA